MGNDYTFDFRLFQTPQKPHSITTTVTNWATGMRGDESSVVEQLNPSEKSKGADYILSCNLSYRMEQ